MFGLLRKAGWIGGLAALARTEKGQQLIARAKAYATDPETRRKLGDLRTKMMSKTRTRGGATVPTPATSTDPV